MMTRNSLLAELAGLALLFLGVIVAGIAADHGEDGLVVVGVIEGLVGIVVAFVAWRRHDEP